MIAAPVTGLEFPKIETLYVRDDTTHHLKPELILKSPVYGLIKTWQWTEKIDGTNIRIIFNRPVGEDAPPASVILGGRTNNAQLPGDLVNTLNRDLTPEVFTAAFPDPGVESVTVFGEGYGAGIQKDGGFYIGSVEELKAIQKRGEPTKRFIVFDVLVNGMWWLDWPNVCDVAAKLNLPVVPFLSECSLEEMTRVVQRGFLSRLCNCKNAEGAVGRTAQPLFDSRGHRLIVKLKTKDF